MNGTPQPNPAVTFYGAVPGCRAPVRADASVLGTLPSRGFQYCEALRAASSFGWYVFPPIDFTLQWDGSQIIWTYRGAKAWYPLTSAQFPGYQAVFDRVAPSALRGFSPPFLTAAPEPGSIQVWTGFLIESAEDWSVLVRPPANLPRSLAFDLYEGIVETDRWFGPLFTNLRLVKTDVPIHFSTETPLVQVQPLHRSAYADEISNAFGVVDDPRAFPPEAWQRYEQTIVKPNVEPAQPVALCDRGPPPAPERLPGRTPSERLRGRGDRSADLGFLSSRYARRRHWLIHATRAGDAALRRRRAAFPALLLLRWRTICRARLAARRTANPVPRRGMGALVICGLQLAPANHAAALGPGVNPAWVALLGFVVFAKRPSSRIIVGATLCAIGVVALAWWGTAERNMAVLEGMRCSSLRSALGALYVLQLRTWGVNAIQGAAIVSLYSALIVVPWYLWSAPAPMWRVYAVRACSGRCYGKAC